MCGGFVGVVSQMSQPRSAQASYHFGRLVTYLVLGAVAGLFGAGANAVGQQFGLTQVAATITGIIMIVCAVGVLVGRPVHIARLLPQRLTALPARLLPVPGSSSAGYSFTLGLCSTFLPCGWLYTYVALAAASGGAALGAGIMAVFWVGTLPMLITIGSISHLVGAPLRKYMPVVSALLMLAAGYFAISGHLVGGLGHHHQHQM